ncbi:UDP-N-acetylglucosamine 1-carboxyvinyltransferase [Desulfovibrionales bacterium]
MDKFVIEGGVSLHGKITISGSKNAALPILLAAPLIDGEIFYSNVPRLHDINTTLRLLNLLGLKATQEKDQVQIVPGALKHEAPYNLVSTMRASILCLGPLLARLNRARVALPGGCAIGARPVDIHLTALEKMGAVFDLDAGYINGRCIRLRGAHIQFPFPTVGGTENILMAASLANGETILENAACEPEVVDLANFLIACGAHIEGHGSNIIHIQGVPQLRGTNYRIMPDRIEAGTYMVAAAITDGELTLINCPCNTLGAMINKLIEMGIRVEKTATGIRIYRTDELVGTDLKTMPYPGFPTDMQAQLMALMCLARGSSVIEETIFENRFMHVQELVRMGARIRLAGCTALVHGIEQLQGAPVMASDLRASASLMLAGLAAKGITEIRRIYHLDRGYEGIEHKLNAIGARVRRVSE